MSAAPRLCPPALSRPVGLAYTRLLRRKPAKLRRKPAKQRHCYPNATAGALKSLCEKICNCVNYKTSLGEDAAIPFEGFRAAVAQVKRHPASRNVMSNELALFDSIIQEQTCWVKELQGELVRCKSLHLLICIAADSCHLWINSFCLTLSSLEISTFIA